MKNLLVTSILLLVSILLNACGRPDAQQISHVVCSGTDGTLTLTYDSYKYSDDSFSTSCSYSDSSNNALVKRYSTAESCTVETIANDAFAPYYQLNKQRAVRQPNQTTVANWVCQNL